MFRSVLRPSSWVSSCTFRSYYVSACLLRFIPVCGGMLSVCVYLRCTCRCGVWMCPSMFPKSGAPIETDAHSRALPNISFGVPSKGALPSGAPNGVPSKRDAPFYSLL